MIVLPINCKKKNPPSNQYLIKRQSSKIYTITFLAGKMIFIAGPTVVAPTKTIKFRTEYDINESFSNPMWLKIKNFLAKEIVFDGAKYSVYNTASASTIKNQKFVIADAEKEGDTAAYQLALDNMRSNKLNIFVDSKHSFIYTYQSFNTFV